ncbi:MAG TPA: M28 family peptidase [Solirubrobacteraceae bacterium]|nr:M28 family peptidase [Solirubrobacteraceae bacterium]
MLNGRLYRAALVPVVFALAIAAFSLTSRPRPLTATLAPDAFQGSTTLAELKSLAAAYPERRPGSTGDEQLAGRIAHDLEGLGGTAGGGFSVQRSRFSGQTIDGERTLTTVVAQRPGSTSATPIVILAHRDAAAPGSQAELSGTAALLELAHVFAARETRRTIILVSTSGGSGGAAGAAAFAAGLHVPVDAAIVLGDLAGTHLARPFVLPFSDGYGSAPLQLQRTLSDALTREAGTNPGAPSTLGQLAHLTFPLTVGEQGPLDAAGIPAVLMQVSGERGPSAREPVSLERLEGSGRAVLSTVDALDAAPDISSTMETGVQLQRKTLPAWALELILATLLLGPLFVAVDGLARMRRRRAPVGRWVLWTLSCALPFFACALFAYLLGRLAVLAAAPPAPAPPGALPLDGSAAAALIAVALVFVLAWVEWRTLVGRLGWGSRPDPEVAGLSILLVLLGVSLLAWALDPFAALLFVPAVHLWLLLAEPELRPRPLGSLALVGLGLAPVLLLVVFYARALGLGPGEVAWMAVLIVAGGHVGLAGALLWSAALGCAAAVVMLCLTRTAAPPGPSSDDFEITIRGPRSYAGPGSLGGTESALRR